MVIHGQEICLDGGKKTSSNLIKRFLLTVNRTIDSVLNR
jgi:hypothetical protein